MDERMEMIAAALEQTNMDWTGCFETTVWIGDNDYRIVVSDGSECVEVKAWFLEPADRSRYEVVSERIAEINESLPCGSFSLDEARGTIAYRNCDLTDGSPVSAQQVYALLNFCRDALERYGDELCLLQEEPEPILFRIFSKLFA